MLTLWLKMLLEISQSHSLSLLGLSHKAFKNTNLGIVSIKTLKCLECKNLRNRPTIRQKAGWGFCCHYLMKATTTNGKKNKKTPQKKRIKHYQDKSENEPSSCM